MSVPYVSPMEAGIHVHKYVKYNPNQGLQMNLGPSFQLQAYHDSDWAACPQTSHLVRGFYIMLGHNPLSWKLKEQHIVILLFIEVEYILVRHICFVNNYKLSKLFFNMLLHNTN